jgi:O-antigen/teichoic acid export membrane protein
LNSPISLGLGGRLKFLARDAFLYGGASAISRALGLITFPILARHFSVAEYGVLDFFFVLASLLTIFAVFGQDSAVGRFFYDTEDRETRRQIVSQSFGLQLAWCCAFVGFAWILSDKLTGALISAPQSDQLLRIVLLQVPFALIVNFAVNLLKWSFDRKRFLIMSLGSALTQATLMVGALLVFDADIMGVLLVSLLTSVLFAGLGLYFVRDWFTSPWRLDHAGGLLKFAAPFGVICIIGVLSPTLERSLIDQTLRPEDLGLYAAAIKIAALLGLGISAFQTAWGPFSIALHRAADAEKTYNLVLRCFTLLVLPSVFILGAASYPLLIVLASPAYAAASAIVLPLALGLAVQAISWIVEIGISISKKSYLQLPAFLAALLITLLGILWLAPQLGLTGVAIAVLAGHAIRAVICAALAQRVYPIPWVYLPVLTMILIASALSLGVLLSGGAGPVPMAIAQAVAAVIILVSGPFILLSADERRHFVMQLHGMKKRIFSARRSQANLAPPISPAAHSDAD